MLETGSCPLPKGGCPQDCASPMVYIHIYPVLRAEGRMQAENEGQRKLSCGEGTASRVVRRRQCCVHGEKEIKNNINVRCKPIVRQ